MLFRDERHNYLIKVTKGRFHTDKGFIDLESLRNKNFGEKITTNMGEDFYILHPSLSDLVMKVNRQTQIIYPKDAGIILMYGTVHPGARIIEAGIGSGAMTTVFANFVRPHGKVYSYEQNIDFLNNARKNVHKNGLSQWVEFKHRKVIDRFDEEDVDFVLIDIGSPWELIDAAYHALKPGHRFATICPTFEQLMRTVSTLKEKGFVNIVTVEVLVRRILVREGRSRPEQRMPSHTGFLILATKIYLSSGNN